MITKLVVLRSCLLILTGILHGYRLRDKFLEMTSPFKMCISITEMCTNVIRKI